MVILKMEERVFAKDKTMQFPTFLVYFSQRIFISCDCFKLLKKLIGICIFFCLIDNELNCLANDKNTQFL